MESGAKSTMHMPGVVYFHCQGGYLQVVLICTDAMHETMAFRSERCASHVHFSCIRAVEIDQGASKLHGNMRISPHA